MRGGRISSAANDQFAGSGSIPTPPLHTFHFDPCSRNDVKEFVETHHYSHSINGIKTSHCFRAKDQWGALVGAAIYGAAATTAWKKYASQETDLLELRRLVFVDEAPKNIESCFVAWTLRWFRRNTRYKTILSYADPRFGHRGVIYRAANFQYLGQTSPDVLYEHPDTKRLYHSRALRTRDDYGNYKPFVRELRRLQQEGRLKATRTPGKHIYLCQLGNRKKRSRAKEIR